MLVFSRGGGDDGLRGDYDLFEQFDCGDKTLLFEQQQHWYFDVAHFGALRLQLDIKNPNCPGFRNIGNFTFQCYWPLDYSAFPLMPRQLPTETSAPRLWPRKLHTALPKAMILPRKKY